MIMIGIFCIFALGMLGEIEMGRKREWKRDSFYFRKTFTVHSHRGDKAAD